LRASGFSEFETARSAKPAIAFTDEGDLELFISMGAFLAETNAIDLVFCQ
jgi:hypothetical protein